MARPSLFLDDGGVMNDNRRRGAQWPGLVSAYFAPRLGGSPAAWAAANRSVVQAQLASASRRARMQAARDYVTFEREDTSAWLAGMCAEVGVPCASGDACVALARQAIAWIIPQVRAAYPGAVAAIRLLHVRGYRLHTASSEPSEELAGHLAAMDVRPCFGHLYGPDLINTFKDGPLYYERLLADARVAPHDAVIVDDSPRAITWAARAGARTVLVGQSGAASQASPCIARLSELPALMQHLG